MDRDFTKCIRGAETFLNIMGFYTVSKMYDVERWDVYFSHELVAYRINEAQMRQLAIHILNMNEDDYPIINNVLEFVKTL